ncbi:hypothetical protein JBL43_17705 [Aureibaculum sp. A20]|uniref:DUF6265 domain-containing protein n=1 Tax=Aureibaculum flavum TaxID=2795986 RepID=A0ABS0WVV8_9FLAO|nr:DUF6265 family protein [Aureibaculum flavum]MBJ2176092.1 hypothetical protein [Aureibaculum flavum]
MRKIIILFGFVFIVFSCDKNQKKTENLSNISESKYNKIESLKWLVGNWDNIIPEQQSYERWKVKNDSTLTAYSYTIVLKDTVFQENMRIQQISNQLMLTVSVPNQNEEQPVEFKLIPESNNEFTFVNEQHDFPSKITYTNPVKDSIHAWVEGQIDSTYKKIDFYFKRSN